MKRAVSSVADMQGLAAGMTQELRGGETLLLYGELGSGKTTFVQGLAKALGVIEPVTSPTFTIVTDYRIPPASPRGAPQERSGDKGGLRGVRSLVHVDLYRLPPGEAVRDPAVQEVLERASEKDRLTVIEWADRLEEKISIWAIRIYFEYGNQASERSVQIITNS